jgi:protein SCO1/2
MGTSEGVEGSKSHVDDGGSYGLVPLVDESGSLIKLQDFLGKPLIVFFGYASCSSVCPTSLAYMAQELDSLGEDRKRVTPMFISVDTNVDSPDKIRNFIRQFAPDIKGVTGSEEHIQRMVAAFKPLGGYYSNTDSSGKHSQAHFQSFVLVDAKGQITGMLAPPFEKGALAKYISTHLKWTGPNGP